jgi:hypothetical protein
MGCFSSDHKRGGTGFSYEDYITGVVAAANPVEIKTQEEEDKKRRKKSRFGVAQRFEDDAIMQLSKGGPLGAVVKNPVLQSGLFTRA